MVIILEIVKLSRFGVDPVDLDDFITPLWSAAAPLILHRLWKTWYVGVPTPRELLKFSENFPIRQGLPCSTNRTAPVQKWRSDFAVWFLRIFTQNPHFNAILFSAGNYPPDLYKSIWREGFCQKTLGSKMQLIQDSSPIFPYFWIH